MEPLKRWDEKVKDLGTVVIGDLGAYCFQGSICVRFDGKSLGIGYIGKTLNDCKKFREEFVRVGCFCWSTEELCYGVPMCPIHPHGICGVDMEMRRAETVQDGDSMMVYTTIKHWGSKEPIAKIHPDCSIEYFGSWSLV